MAAWQNERTMTEMATLLIVDDDERLTGPIAKQLTALGFRVLVAADGNAGLR